MTTVVTLKNSDAYAIYVDGEMIIECNTPTNTFNEVIKNTSIPNFDVTIIELEYFPKTMDFTPSNNIDARGYYALNTDEILDKNSIKFAHTQFQVKIENQTENTHEISQLIDDYKKNITFDDNTGLIDVNVDTFDKINDSIDFHTPNMSAYNRQNVGVQLDLPTEKTLIVNDESISIVQNEPIGNIDVPKIGDLVYIEGVQGILKTVMGGVGTVGMVFFNKINNDFEEDDDNVEEEDIEDIEIKSNILIELEEIPGQYFSWDELKSKQNDLKLKYGYKPAMIL